MRSDRSGERLACPHCRANNFVGQAQCWQCRGSLPPPEEQNGRQGHRETGRPPVQAPSASISQYAPPIPSARPVRSKTPLVLCIALLTACVLVAYGARQIASRGSGSAQVRGVAPELNREASGVVPLREMPNSGLPDANGVRLSMPERDPLPPSADPTEMAAKRAIEHAIPRLGLPPGTPPDGDVHLRNGDTISREQYEEARRKLQQNPLTDSHSVPRL